MNKSVEVFCCYAREDRLLLEKLKKQLMPLVRERLITLWADTDIRAGAEWEKEIHLHLETSHIILLLISSDFMASEYCCTEMTQAMKRHESGQAQVIPIILRPVEWQNTPFAVLQVLPQDAHPIISSKWRYSDEGFADAAKGIREAVEALFSREGQPRLAQQTLAPREPKPVRLEEKQWLKEEGTYEPGEAQRVLAASSSRRSPRLPRVRFNPRFVVLVLLALFLLSGVVSLIYRTAVGHFPWQASPGLSTTLPPPHTTPLSMSALGQSWHSGDLDNSGDLSGVAWSGSRFVAVGGSCKLFFFFCSGVIFTSPDGITWTSQNSGTSQHLSSVAWSGSRFVIVGDNGTVLTSSDGINWNPQDSHITGDLSSVAWLDSRFVAVGGSCRLFSFFCSDTIFTSPDGITWNPQHTPTNQHLHSVAWSGSRFVIVGDSGTIFTSPDGITWNPQSSGTAVDLLSVVWSGSRFVIVGDSGTILTSSDGITWTTQHPPTTKNLDDIVWSGSRFVIVGDSGTIFTSPDGITWNPQNSGTSQDLDDIVWSGSRFVTVGVSGVISTSP